MHILEFHPEDNINLGLGVCKDVPFDDMCRIDQSMAPWKMDQTLDDGLWSRLSWDLVALVLSFLPVPDLCRHRCVCKEWDMLICSEEFGAVHGRNGSKGDASYMVMRCMTELWSSLDFGERQKRFSTWKQDIGGFCHSRSWGFLDLGARRWYTVLDKTDIPPEVVYPNELEYMLLEPPLVVAMDGGLVCRQTYWPSDSISVYNPLSKSMRKLPNAPYRPEILDTPRLHLIVDSVSQKFKILRLDQLFLDELYPETLQEPKSFLSVYDSATNQWKCSTSHPFSSIESIEKVEIKCSIMFEGLLYAIMLSVKKVRVRRRKLYTELWRYNPTEDAWERVNNVAHIELYMGWHCKLCASANRLFLIKSTRQPVWIDGSEERIWKLVVDEINSPGMKQVERFLEISKVDVMKVLGVHVKQPETDITVAGFGNSLLFGCKTSRKLMVLDVKTRQCDQLPRLPEGTSLDFKGFNIIVGQQMNLMLPSTTWWQESHQAN